MQEEAGNLAEKDRSTKRPDVLDETDFLELEQPLAKRMSFPEEKFGGDGVMVKNL